MTTSPNTVSRLELQLETDQKNLYRPVSEISTTAKIALNEQGIKLTFFAVLKDA